MKNKMGSLYRLFLQLFILCILILSSNVTFAKRHFPFHKIVFFGDSLTDNGNLYRSDIGLLPKSPPYYAGRFSNAEVWSERLATYFSEMEGMTSSNYAVGGETVVFHNPFDGYLPFFLRETLNNYLIETFWQKRSDTLFIIWIGANDYLNGSKEVEEATTSVVENIKYVIETLISHGARNFLLLNLPNLSRIPYAIENHVGDNLGALSAKHNEKLMLVLDEIKNSYKTVNINLYDLNKMFDDLLDNIDVYNKKFNTHISNTVNACWQGGYTLTKDPEMERTIQNQLDEQLKLKLKTQTNSHLSGDVAKVDTQALAHFIVKSPALMEAYRVQTNAANGEQPCDDPDSYVFWDHVHPTGVVHMLLSYAIVEYIQQHYFHKD